MTADAGGNKAGTDALAFVAAACAATYRSPPLCRHLEPPAPPAAFAVLAFAAVRPPQPHTHTYRMHTRRFSETRRLERGIDRVCRAETYE